MVKSLFRFGQVLLNLTCMFAAHHQKIFVPWFFKVFIDHLQVNLITLSLEKEIIVLEKSLGKVLNFGSKNLYETWALLLYNTHFESLGQPTQSITLPEIAVPIINCTLLWKMFNQLSWQKNKISCWPMSILKTYVLKLSICCLFFF